LIKRNVLIKTKVVQKDEFEKAERRLLNFGHTLGHALENQYELSHGQAIAIGMTYACHISEQLSGFKQTEKVVKVLEQYGLPTYASFNKKKALGVLKMDKERERKEIFKLPLRGLGHKSESNNTTVQVKRIDTDTSFKKFDAESLCCSIINERRNSNS
jgi:3-dehydroquinate synthase